MRPSAVLIGMQSWQRESPQGWREYSQYWMAPASRPSAMSHRSASLSLSAILLARSTVFEKAASKVSAIGSMKRSIGITARNRNAHIPSIEPMFNGTASFEADAVQSQALRALVLGAKQREIGDLLHIHQAVARRMMNILERNTQRLALFRSDVEPGVEPV